MKNGELNGGGTDERRCPICGKRCQNKSALAVHLFWKHRNIKPGESDQVTEIDNERPKVDETKNTFIIETDDGKQKKIAKKTAKFEFNIEGKKIIIDGSKIVYRPEDRIKKVR